MSTAATVDEDHRKASWAEWEAQARILDGDYDGAIAAEQRAAAVRQKAEQQERPAGISKQ